MMAQGVQIPCLDYEPLGDGNHSTLLAKKGRRTEGWREGGRKEKKKEEGRKERREEGRRASIKQQASVQFHKR